MAWIPDTRKFTIVPVDPDEPKQGWECYDCNSTSGFTPHVDWETNVQDDVECNECGSLETGPEGEGPL